MIELQNVSKQFGSKVLFENLNLYAEPGETVLVRGASGSGKTTLLNIIAGLVPSHSGKVVVACSEPWRLTDEDRTVFRGRTIGYVRQDARLVPWLTVSENILLPGWNNGTRKFSPFVQGLVGKLGIESFLGTEVALLSGGERQRVSLARTFSAEPAIVLADEPTNNLDQDLKNSFFDILREYRDECPDTVIVLTTHESDIPFNPDKEIRL